jgi:hypothetical protein
MLTNWAIHKMRNGRCFKIVFCVKAEVVAEAAIEGILAPLFLVF